MKLKILPIPLLLIALLSLPLALGIIPPNWVYGYRASHVWRSRDAWYVESHLAGLVGVLLGLAGAALIALMVRMRSIPDSTKINTTVVLIILVGMGMTVTVLLGS